ncbi:hypothetical protein D8M05_07635 [Oceanobacillus bengalensis]|uniref:Peptidyl-prolyl cis-trans isomerase n=2 Tax=Oceanobacillus bengalensis TaxID=1435466 RepID=A0A494Z1T3_9BACI|nr:hypothetical protein [Oceanobacillus bengalensis]RKQ16398.1 hypothetical protein D8M05_07635 [Oceanobacillus bengalensis]
MIVPIVGNVSYSITLDPTVWIFDDRKVLLEEAFTIKANTTDKDDVVKAAERWDREVSTQFSKPPVNRSISRREGETFLENSYVMPIYDFIHNAEINTDAKNATLVTWNDESDVTLTIDELESGYFLFAMDGKPLKEDGPVHFLYGDGSNKDNPIKHVKKIHIH